MLADMALSCILSMRAAFTAATRSALILSKILASCVKSNVPHLEGCLHYYSTGTWLSLLHGLQARAEGCHARL
jgi:hypothetical protein